MSGIRNLIICATLFSVALITSNALETKQMVFMGIPITGGLLVFPISYILNDCISEVWGWKIAKSIIWLGFAMNAFFIFFGALTDAIPGASYWQMQEGFHAIFGLVPRIAAASLIAFLAGSFLNSYIMVKLRDRGTNSFSFRAITSTLAGETVDSLVFFPIALGGIVPGMELLKIMLLQICLKTLYEIIILPITIRLVKFLKQ